MSGRRTSDIRGFRNIRDIRATSAGKSNGVYPATSATFWRMT
jgi:hypothetical protein